MSCEAFDGVAGGYGGEEGCADADGLGVAIEAGEGAAHCYDEVWQHG